MVINNNNDDDNQREQELKDNDVQKEEEVKQSMVGVIAEDEIYKETAIQSREGQIDAILVNMDNHRKYEWYSWTDSIYSNTIYSNSSSSEQCGHIFSTNYLWTTTSIKYCSSWC